MDKIKALLFDVDGVMTDGRKYINGEGIEIKSLALKDIDTFQLLKNSGYIIGCITGEDTVFCRQLIKMQPLDYAKVGCKRKVDALNEVEEKYHITSAEICYIGDGKYDIDVLEKVGLAVCPNDAIEEVKKVSDIVLKTKGGEGCIAETYTLLRKMNKESVANCNNKCTMASVLTNRIAEHQDIISKIIEDTSYIKHLEKAINILLESYQNRGCLFLCGNGGSAADAQHLAAEMVGRFYLERKALSAEALTVNTSILTSLANDYDYNMIFARQLEAKAEEGDVLIGITTSGTSENIIQAFQKAKEMHLKTILMTGDISEYTPILRYTDCLLAVPSQNTPRIQEVHILTGHIICEIVEQKLVE